MNGGSGNDTFIVDSLLDVIVEDYLGGTDTLVSSVLDSLATYSLAKWTYVENLTYSGALASQSSRCSPPTSPRRPSSRTASPSDRGSPWTSSSDETPASARSLGPTDCSPRATGWGRCRAGPP